MRSASPLLSATAAIGAVAVAVAIASSVGCRSNAAQADAGSAGGSGNGAAVDTSATGGCARLPAGFVPDAMVRAAVPDDVRLRASVTVRVLAWQTRAGGDAALLWVLTQSKSGGNSWQLAHVERASGGAWTLATSETTPFSALQGFGEPPTHAEADAFFDVTRWPFGAPDGKGVTGSEVCADAWRTSFHEPAWH